MNTACLPAQFSTANFSLEVNYGKSATQIMLKMLNKVICTSNLPSTCTILEKLLPTIYTSTCYNDNNLPFSQEVLNTETGHLFEHILLEYLCIEKLSQGYDDAIYEGVTTWDWNKYKFGTFYIDIKISNQESNIFLSALQKAINLFETILKNSCTHDVHQGTIQIS